MATASPGAHIYTPSPEAFFISSRRMRGKPEVIA
jgi:hypothetical protein